ncbi:MAG: hypothetical protein QM719_09280 [Thermomonas sp.]
MRGLRIALLSALLATTVAFATTASTSDSAVLHVAAADQRTPDQTFLTFPEWFLVFSPAEYADMLRDDQPADAFPFFGHVAQFWKAYARVIGATRAYPFNGEYHTMIVVIGVSTTVEYAIKGAYETLFGRLSALTASPNATPEDRLATEQARAYVDFIRIEPWYKFDFVAPLKRLWTEVPWTGPHLLRKWERRYLLTSEWMVKAAYAALIKRATGSTFDAPKPTTLAVVHGLADVGNGLPDMQVLKHGDKLSLLSLPRYQPFTDHAIALAKQGIDFDEIAGNHGTILVSLIVPTSREVDPRAPILIRQPIVTRPGFERRVLQVPVPRLADTLRMHASAGDAIEHVFDY